jgi:hypothetical protein
MMIAERRLTEQHESAVMPKEPKQASLHEAKEYQVLWSKR